MSPTLQHLLVVTLAVACLVGLIVRRVRMLRGEAPACDGCAKSSGGCAPGASDKLVPPQRLVRR